MFITDTGQTEKLTDMPQSIQNSMPIKKEYIEGMFEVSFWVSQTFSPWYGGEYKYEIIGS